MMNTLPQGESVHPEYERHLRERKELEEKLRGAGFHDAYIKLYLAAPDMFTTLKLVLRFRKPLTPELVTVLERIIDSAEYREAE